MKDSTVTHNSTAQSIHYNSGEYQNCSQDPLTESLVRYETELTRQQHRDELSAEVGKRLKIILKKPEAKNFLAASNEEKKMAYAMAAIETFIKRSTPTS